MCDQQAVFPDFGMGGVSWQNGFYHVYDDPDWLPVC